MMQEFIFCGVLTLVSVGSLLTADCVVCILHLKWVSFGTVFVVHKN